MVLIPCLLATCWWDRGITGVLPVQMWLSRKCRVLLMLEGHPTTSVPPLNRWWSTLFRRIITVCTEINWLSQDFWDLHFAPSFCWNRLIIPDWLYNKRVFACCQGLELAILASDWGNKNFSLTPYYYLSRLLRLTLRSCLCYCRMAKQVFTAILRKTILVIWFS